MSENSPSYKITVEPRKLPFEEIQGISNEMERAFALLAFSAGLEIFDGGMITLGKNSQLKQRSTNPDFLIKGPGFSYYVEITEGENLGSRKAKQKAVMDAVGLPYIQLTGSEVTALIVACQNKSPEEKRTIFKKLSPS